MGFITIFAIAVMIIAAVYYVFIHDSKWLDDGEKFARLLIVIVIFFVATGMILAFDCTHEEELCEKKEMYSLPLVSISEQVINGYYIPQNTYVITNSNEEYIFYTVYHTNELIKQTAEKDNVIITFDDFAKPFVKVYKETYNKKNLIGSIIGTYTIEKYHLVIPHGGYFKSNMEITSDSILTSL